MSMSDHNPARGAAIGLDHVGIVGADLDALAQTFGELGFHLTPYVVHASGRTANRCAFFRDGGYLELISTVSGQTSATLEGFLKRGPGAHILALEIDDATAVSHRAGPTAAASMTERDTGLAGAKAKFALVMPPDQPEGRVLLIRHLTREVLWRPDMVVHPNHAFALTEVVYASGSPARTMTGLSRIAGRPAEPDPLGGYRIALARGCIRVLTDETAAGLFAGQLSAVERPALVGVTIAAGIPDIRVVHAGGVAIRFVPLTA
jgi:hypothetical protein